MSWFNPYGLAVMLVIMVPNIIFAFKNQDGFTNKYNNRAVEIFEQIGRYGCFVMMVINIPGTYLGFSFPGALALYLITDGLLLFLYCLIWYLMRNRPGIIRSLALSVLPSMVFLVSALLLAYWPLLIFALIFSVFHVLLSYKNAK